MRFEPKKFTFLMPAEPGTKIMLPHYLVDLRVVAWGFYDEFQCLIPLVPFDDMDEVVRSINNGTFTVTFADGGTISETI